MNGNEKRSGRTFARHVVVAVAGAMVLSASGLAAAQDKVVGEFGWFGVGKAHEIEKGHFFWVGEFGGTFFNDKGEGSPMHRSSLKCPAWADLDFNSKKASYGGYCTVTDLDGDQAYLSWRIPVGSPIPGTKGAGTFDYTGGTGKYKNLTGRNSFYGVTQVNWADGSTTGYSAWNK